MKWAAALGLLGLLVIVAGMVTGDYVLWTLGAGLVGLPGVVGARLDRMSECLVQQFEVEQACLEQPALPPAYPDHPGTALLTRQYLAGTLDVDQYTEAVEALPWTPTDSSRRAATPATCASVPSDSTAGGCYCDGRLVYEGSLHAATQWLGCAWRLHARRTDAG